MILNNTSNAPFVMLFVELPVFLPSLGNGKNSVCVLTDIIFRVQIATVLPLSLQAGSTIPSALILPGTQATARAATREKRVYGSSALFRYVCFGLNEMTE